MFARFGLRINRNEGQLVLSSNPQRPRLLNVEAIERIVQRGFFPERFHDTSPVLHVLRPWWLLVDIVVVLLQVAICVLIMVIPLALFSVHELARESFYPMSPVDSLTSAHFGPRFAQLSERLLFASPTLTLVSAIYAAALFGFIGLRILHGSIAAGAISNPSDIDGQSIHKCGQTTEAMLRQDGNAGKSLFQGHSLVGILFVFRSRFWVCSLVLLLARLRCRRGTCMICAAGVNLGQLCPCRGRTSSQLAELATKLGEAHR